MTLDKNISLIIVDDHASFRQGLRFFLESSYGYNIIAEASNGKEFLELPNLSQADIVLIDMRMPVMGGVEAAKQALWEYNQMKIIAITMYQDEAYLKQLLETGFKGCIFKGDIHSEIGKAIETVIGQGYYFPKNIKREESTES